MQINTKPYGSVEINAEEIIYFDHGLIGFEDKHKFILLKDNENGPLIWLQSLENENLAFVVMEPRIFKPDYQPSISIEELSGLDIEGEEGLILYSIVVVPEDVKKMTVNLRAPVIINHNSKKGKQIVLNDDRYKVKEPIFA